MVPFRTRLAPSPTGSLHLGNARTFLINWWMARQAGGQVLLRIEDLDRGRVKPGLEQRALLDLEWLGLTWDEPPVRQSERHALYEQALAELRDRDLVYPCVCSRKEVAAASAPHQEDERPDSPGHPSDPACLGYPAYPGTCRGRFRDAGEAREASGREPCWRFRVPAGELSFADRFRGVVRLDPARWGGDFIVRSTDGGFAYQLAVTVDDALTGITEVVRGDDLVPSTPRQLLLYRALGHTPPRFTHLPLVLDDTDRRMAKRHGDSELSALRERGIDPGEVIAHLARLSGIEGVGRSARTVELTEQFRLDRVPGEPVRAGRPTWSTDPEGAP